MRIDFDVALHQAFVGLALLLAVVEAVRRSLVAAALAALDAVGAGGSRVMSFLDGFDFELCGFPGRFDLAAATAVQVFWRLRGADPTDAASPFFAVLLCTPCCRGTGSLDALRTLLTLHGLPLIAVRDLLVFDLVRGRGLLGRRLGFRGGQRRGAQGCHWWGPWTVAHVLRHRHSLALHRGWSSVPCDHRDPVVVSQPALGATL